MKNTKGKDFFYHYIDIFILLIICIIAIPLALLGAFKKSDYRIYDILLGWCKEPKTQENIVLIDIDDISLNEIGSWPWTRDILADVLIRSKELGIANIVFDIEYLSPSTPVVAPNIDSVLQDSFVNGEDSIARSINYFAENITSGALPLAYVAEASNDFIYNSIDPILLNMLNNIASNLRVDNDNYFAQSAQFFGNAFFTINTRNLQIEVPNEAKTYVENRFLTANVLDPKGLIPLGNVATLKEEGRDSEIGFEPAIHSIINHGAGAGFTNVVLDGDGSRRRVELLFMHDNKYIEQLVFAPLLKMLDVKEIERNNRSLVLKDCLLPNASERTNINIPLDSKGRMLINWLKGSYIDTFKHVGVYAFKYLDDGETAIYNLLLAINSADKTAFSQDDISFIQNASYLIDEYKEILNAKKQLLTLCEGIDINGNAINGGIPDEYYASYYDMRNEYFDNVQAFAQSLASMQPLVKNNDLEQLFVQLNLKVS